MISYEGKIWNVCVVTPAGRAKHLSVLKRYIYKEMESGLVDEWQLWKNTDNYHDITYIESMRYENPKVKVIDIGLGQYSAFNIYKFYQYTVEDDTIYLRFDDDIIFVEEGACRKLVVERLKNQHAFVICANIVNNTLISWIHQDIGALDKDHGVANFTRMDEVAHQSSQFAQNVHDTFIKKHSEYNLRDYKFPNKVLKDFDPFSISCFAYFGHDLQPINDVDEELWISSLRPKATNRPCEILGDALVVHYGYHTQRAQLEEKPYIYDFYNNL